MRKIIFVLISISVFVTSCTYEKFDLVPVVCTSMVSYSATIKPIIDAKCSIPGCHVSGGAPGNFTIFSELKSKIDNGSFDKRVIELKDMPPPGSTALTDDELAELSCWIEQGAPNN